MESLSALDAGKKVPNKDTFSIHKKGSQKVCWFCTMVSQYEKGLVKADKDYISWIPKNGLEYLQWTQVPGIFDLKCYQ